MPFYRYTARSRTGEKVEGTLDESDKGAALRAVERLGHIPLSITDVQDTSAKKKQPRAGSKRVRGATVLVFTSELRDLLASGMKVGQALTILARRSSGGRLDAVIAELRDHIIQGRGLSDALALYPSVFPSLYVAMIRAGEMGGATTDALERLVSHYQRMQALKEKLVSALIYPAVVLLVGAGTLVFSMVFVIPRFAVIFFELDSTLPLPTRMLIGASEFLVRYGIFLLAALGGVAVMVRQALKTNDGRAFWHRAQLRLPILRSIIEADAFARFARTLATLLANGVPVLQALTIVERTMGNTVISREIRNARDRVTDGTTISGPLAAGRVFPPLMTDMLAVGEQTGDIARSLNHIANRYENELDHRLKIMTTILEPLLIVFMAILVGFVAISMLLAVFDLTSGLNV